MLANAAIIVVVLVLLSAMVYCMRRRQAALEQAFPPISDAEYLALCRPGTNPDVALKVRKVLAEALNVDWERIYPSSRLIQDLGAE